jgi:hypothetical protein
MILLVSEFVAYWIDVGLAAKPTEPKDTIDEVSRPTSNLWGRDHVIWPTRTTLRVLMQREDCRCIRMKRNAEQNFELGAVKFTLSLKSGLNFFIDNDFVERDAKAIATLHNKPNDTLDKTQMEEYWQGARRAFVKGDGIDPKGRTWLLCPHSAPLCGCLPTGMMFDDPIRLFLSGFRPTGNTKNRQV